MFLRAFAAALLLLVPTQAAPDDLPPQLSAIPEVVCAKPGGGVSGTAFRVGPHLLVTARHVANEAPCTVQGAAMTVKYSSPDSDFAVLTGVRPGPFMHVNCGGYIKGRLYAALGHARGIDEITRVEMVALGVKHSSGMDLLAGIFTTVPGQSGGPIVDAETGEAVGIVNASNFEAGVSASVALKDTPICNGSLA